MEASSWQQKNMRTIEPLPYAFYFWPVVVLAFAGLADSVYLAFSHYRVYTDIGYKSFCAISRAINCDTVSQSHHSIFLGLPVPVWGVIGYTLLLMLLLPALNQNTPKKRIWSLVFWLSLAFSGYSVVLAVISSYLIGSYCIMCIVSYGVNLALLFYAWIIRRRFSGNGLFADTTEDIRYLWQSRVKAGLTAVVFLVVVAATWIVFPTYWQLQPPPVDANTPRGITASGHPWIGAHNPVLEIREYSDYQCFQCKKMHRFLRRLVAEHPDRIRLVHHNYPMDHRFNPIVKAPFHQGSGKMALLAIYAASKNKFWELNDHLYDLVGRKQQVEIKYLAQSLGLNAEDMAYSLNHRSTHIRLQRDIREGNKLGISGTPGYVINGKVYLGQIPADVLKIAMR
jgi:uncharacterized membrane protein/protein-disulfide isomerase